MYVSMLAMMLIPRWLKSIRCNRVHLSLTLPSGVSLPSTVSHLQWESVPIPSHYFVISFTLTSISCEVRILCNKLLFPTDNTYISYSAGILGYTSTCTCFWPLGGNYAAMVHNESLLVDSAIPLVLCINDRCCFVCGIENLNHSNKIFAL